MCFNPPCGCVAFSTRTSRICSARLRQFQSALRMRGLFNTGEPGTSQPQMPRFNPPCGCVAFSTPQRERPSRCRARFNPPCGCVAFSTLRSRAAAPRLLTFQSALRMRGLFNRAMPTRTVRPQPMFQSALRMRGLFNWLRSSSWLRIDSFNPPCGCVAFSTLSASVRPGGELAFQSALRMRGLFNPLRLGPNRPANSVFQSALRMRGLFNHPDAQGAPRVRVGFNPPCGCVAFSTQC